MRYIDALCREIREEARSSEEGSSAARTVPVQSVFFGGGTPSCLDAGLLRKVLDNVRECYEVLPDAEITVECNPGTLSRNKLDTYRSMKVNRLSLGLQSSHNEELKKLGRIHTWEDFLENYGAARTAGFDNINVDLMYALPGQSVRSWEDTLRKVSALHPEHISAYSLMIEEGTPFYEMYHKEKELRDLGEKTMHLPSEEEEQRMDALTNEILCREGMYRYEISNYARRQPEYSAEASAAAAPRRKNYECRHNNGYWLRRPYRGFGLGSASLVSKNGREIRFHNTTDLNGYLSGDFSEKDLQKLTPKDAMEETMFLGLRRMEGVDRRIFSRKFGKSVGEVYGDVLAKLAGQGLICLTNTHVCLTCRGIDVSNRVLAEFLL